jgi:hypothetical protein
MNLVACPVPHRLHLRGLLVSLLDGINLSLYLSLVEVLVSRLCYGCEGLSHVLCCALSIDHVSEGALLKIEMSKNSTN